MSRDAGLTADDFLRHESLDLAAYRELARIETVPQFKRILDALAAQEAQHYQFWRELSALKDVRVSRLQLGLLVLMRKVLGLTFTAKFLERQERDAVTRYTAFARQAPPELQGRLQDIISQEAHHEQDLIGQIREERVKFLGSMVLGVNDGLIELTGALTGFAFALADPVRAGLFGTVTGLAASLSMAASAYMQARHEAGRDPRRAAAYTGLSYLAVVSLLVLPFFLLPTLAASLAAMAAIILLLIAGFAGYSAIVFDRPFKRQFLEMAAFSLGVAGLASLLGSLVRALLGAPPAP